MSYIDIICDNSIDIKIEAALNNKYSVVSNFTREVNSIKDKNLKLSLLSAIIDGNLDKAANIQKTAMKILSTAAKRMEKHRRNKGVVSREEYLTNSISSKKPWLELKISRATWYRRGMM